MRLVDDGVELLGTEHRALRAVAVHRPVAGREDLDDVCAELDQLADLCPKGLGAVGGRAREARVRDPGVEPRRRPRVIRAGRRGELDERDEESGPGNLARRDGVAIAGVRERGITDRRDAASSVARRLAIAAKAFRDADRLASSSSGSHLAHADVCVAVDEARQQAAPDDVDARRRQGRGRPRRCARPRRPHRPSRDLRPCRRRRRRHGRPSVPRPCLLSTQPRAASRAIAPLASPGRTGSSAPMVARWRWKPPTGVHPGALRPASTPPRRRRRHGAGPG